LALSGALMLSGVLAAQPKARVVDAPPVVPTLAAATLEPWLDGYMREVLNTSGIPGAVVSVVADGRILLAKGYGVADVGAQRPVDAQATLFRVGSISKLFTWTAVMQLVEQGRIDLDTDINQYLDFTIPQFQGKPITMRNLMTHTAGFEEAKRGLATLHREQLISLGEAVKRDLPARVYAPGSTPAYSNYGASLAAYIVQRRSGEEFSSYVSRHIFQPLGMERSTFQQPLPSSLARNAAVGYMSIFAPPGDFELVNWAPAGGLSATGEDMGRFMLSYLEGGDTARPRALKADTVRLLLNSPTTFIPVVNRSTLGFAERDVNGRRAVGHDGDTILFHSLLGLYPQYGVGMFVSFNGPGMQGAAWAAREKLFADFSDRFLPAEPAPPSSVTPELARQHARLFASAYASSRSNSTSFMAAKKLLLPVRVLRYADGSISLSGLRRASGELKRFREVAPFVWHEVDGHDRLAAIASDGRITRLGVDDVSATAVFDALPEWRSPSWLFPAFCVALIALVATLAARPIGALVRRSHGLTRQLSSPRQWADGLASGTGLIAVLAMMGWAWIFLKALDPVSSYLLSDYDTVIVLVEALTLLSLLGLCAAAIFRAFVVWRERSPWVTRVNALALIAAALVTTFTAALYKLMSFSVAY
jgi:CubicO group peptidase (beta-lactamase class C family)